MSRKENDVAKVLSAKLHRHLKAKMEAAAARPPVTASCDPRVRGMRPSGEAPSAAPPFAGKYASDAALDRYFQAMGWDRSAATFGPPPPRVEDPQLAAVEALAAARRAALAEVRRAQVEAGSIDARVAPASQVAERVSALGGDVGGYGLHFRDPGRPLAPDPARGSEASLEARAAHELEFALQQARQSGQRSIDVRALSAHAFTLYMRRLGGGGWDVDGGAREV